MFQTHFDLPLQNVSNITGSGKAIIGKAEANLDVQYIMVTGQNIPTDFWLQGGDAFDLVGWAQDVLNADDPALIWSVSYGEDISTVTASYAQRLNQEFQKMATLGISILFASGA